MAKIKTVHHMNIDLGELISVNCPVCKTNKMLQDQEKPDYWVCEHGHSFWVNLYQSSVDSLNLAFVYQEEKPH